MKLNLFVLLIVSMFCSCNLKKKTDSNDIAPLDSICFRSAAYINAESINYSIDSNFQINVAYIDSDRHNVFIVNSHSSIIDSFSFPKQVSDNRAMIEYSNKTLTLFSLSDNLLLKLHNGNSLSIPVANSGLFLNPMFANFELIKNSAIFYQLPLNSQLAPRDSEGFFDVKILGIYGIRNDSFVQEKSYITYPRVFQKLKYPESPPVCNRKNENELYYLFNFSDSLSFIDIQSDRHTNYYIDGFPKCKLYPYSSDSMGILSYAKQQALRNEIFAKILFDKSSSDFILIKLLGIEQQNTNSIYEKTFKDKPVVVYLIHNFKVIKTFRILNGSSLSPINSYYYGHKLYVSNSDHTKVYVYNI